jgi:hypothetical protein
LKTALVLLLLFQHLLVSTASRAAAGKVLGLPSLHHASARQLQQLLPENQQKALQRMLPVPIATPQSVLALGHKGLDPAALRNWHVLARKLTTPGANVTIITFGESLTTGYLLSSTEPWRNSLEGSWVEQLLAWLKVGALLYAVNEKCLKQ